MAEKLLISALSNSGKTTLLKDLEDVLVIAIDGKVYPFPQPHVNVSSFNTIEEFTNLISEKVEAYQEKFDKLPKTIAIDSVSRVFELIANNCNVKYQGFNIYTELNKEVAAFTQYIEDVLIANDMNVVIVSHAVWDADTNRYVLVAQGSFAKSGGFLSVVDNSIFLEVKGSKRIVHHRTAKYASRTTLEDIPDTEPADEYNLQDHIDKLATLKGEVTNWSI